jgi:hypothetical protein
MVDPKMGFSIVLVLLVVGTPATAVFLDRCLKFYWKDGRTRTHRIARTWLIALSAAAVGTGVFYAIYEKVRGEKEKQRLAAALRDAERDRKARADAGRLENQDGLGQIYLVGDSSGGIMLTHKGSLLDNLFPPSCPLHEISEANSISSSRTAEGKLLVSARLTSRDGLLVEIHDNEWKVSPPPRSWDRNYSTNALEVKDAEGNVVFQVRLRPGVPALPSQSVLSFQGVFFGYHGQWVAFIGGPGQGYSLLIPTTNSPVPFPVLKPLFKYPSSLHLGEPAD